MGYQSNHSHNYLLMRNKITHIRNLVKTYSICFVFKEIS